MSRLDMLNVDMWNRICRFRIQTKNMKKLLFLLLLIPGIGLSQSIGFKTGIITPIKSGNMISGVYGLTLHFGKKIQFGIEPSYFTRAYHRNPFNIEVKNNYIEMPLTIGYLGGGKVLYNGNIGLSPQVLISGSRNGESVNVSNNLGLDAIFTAGIGYKFTDRFSGLVNFRYANNLTRDNDYISAFINIRYIWQ